MSAIRRATATREEAMAAFKAKWSERP